MPIQFPAQGFNPDPGARMQRTETNALINTGQELQNDANTLIGKANQQAFDQGNRKKAGEMFVGMGKQALELLAPFQDGDPEGVAAWGRLYPEVVSGLESLGIPTDKVSKPGTPLKQIRGELAELGKQGQIILSGMAQEDPSLVKDAAGYNRFAGGDNFGERAFPTVVAEPGANGSIPAKIQQAEWWLAADENSRTAYMTANYAGSIKDINGIPTWVFPGGATLPLSTAASEDAAAAQRKLVEGEGSRGRLQNDEGTFEEVPGSEADIKKKEADRKRAGGAFMKSIQAQTVVEDVGRLNVMLDADEVPFGRAAMIQEKLTPALQSDAYRNATSLIDSVKGNVGIDSLLRIKASGAGLGQVPQSQLDMLSQLLGDLHLKQSREQFMYTWNRMGVVYEIVMDQAEDDLYSLDVESPNVSAESIALKQAREAILDGSGTRETVIKKLTENGYDASKL